MPRRAMICLWQDNTPKDPDGHTLRGGCGGRPYGNCGNADQQSNTEMLRIYQRALLPISPSRLPASANSWKRGVCLNCNMFFCSNGARVSSVGEMQHYSRTTVPFSRHCSCCCLLDALAKTYYVCVYVILQYGVEMMLPLSAGSLLARNKWAGSRSLLYCTFFVTHTRLCCLCMVCFGVCHCSEMRGVKDF